MSQQDKNELNKTQDNCSETCKDGFLVGLFQLMDKLEEENQKEDDAQA